jgi:hypothetical protein
MDIQQRIEDSKTSIFKTVYPNSTNYYDTLFGIAAMRLMDEVYLLRQHILLITNRLIKVSNDRIEKKLVKDER